MRRALPWLVMLAAELAAASSAWAAAPPSGQERIAAEISQNLGGLVVTNDRNQVVSVDFEWPNSRMASKNPPIFFGRPGDLALRYLRGLPQLESLNLRGTEVTDAGLANLSGLVNLRSLNLWSTAVSDAGLAHLRGATRLQSLVLAHTKVTDAGLAQLQRCTQLESLDLSGLAISGSSLVHFRGMSRLRSLDLAMTQVPDAALANLQGLSQLESLNLSGSLVTDAGMDWIAGLTRLKSLNLGSTRVTDRGLARVAGLTRLETLNLGGGMAISDAGLVHLRGLTQLRWLNLGGAEDITDAGLANLASLSQLDWLRLTDTQITDAGLVHLRGLTRLRSLSLDNTDSADLGLMHLSGLTGLESLSLSNTRVTDAGLPHLKTLGKLRYLALFGTNVTDAGLLYFSGLTSLEELNLNKTQVTDAGASTLRKALPKCRIFSFIEKPIQRPPKKPAPPVRAIAPADVDRLLWWLPAETESVVVSAGYMPLQEPVRVQRPQGVPNVLPQGEGPVEGATFEIPKGAKLEDFDSYVYPATKYDYQDLIPLQCQTPLRFTKPLEHGNVAVKLLLTIFGPNTARLFASAVWWRGDATRETCDIIVFNDGMAEQMIRSLSALPFAAHSVDGVRALEVPLDFDLPEMIGLSRLQVADLNSHDAGLAGKRWLAAPHPSVYVAATSKEFLQAIIGRMRERGARRALPPELPEWQQLDTSLPAWGLRHYRRATADKDKMSMLNWDPNATGLVFFGGAQPSPHLALRYISASPDAGRRFFEMQKFWLARFPFRKREIEGIAPFAAIGPNCVESRTRINVPTAEIDRKPLRNLAEESTFSYSMPLMFLPWLGFPFGLG